MKLKVINVGRWISENEQSFLPPVCNKLMHNDQLKIMYVGGPNIRKDYHIEEGEELFYMLKGDMILKIVEKGEHKDVLIKEGEIFLLPARIPHSPQRKEDTVGLVIERERSEVELDILRYFVDNSTDILFEKKFQCANLGTQLAPLIKEFFNSEPHKTGIPNQDFLIEKMPFKLDQESAVMKPQSLQDALSQCNSDNSLFGQSKHKNQFEVKVFCAGSSEFQTGPAEHWIWQKSGSSCLKIGNDVMQLLSEDSILVPPKTSYVWDRGLDGKALRFICDPERN
ncbi:3-hydroxyanthranilate 3,4-dioxygenase-like [Clavelina lepadiformis]|uniref:3-hydroxyanthranilate 3,4-dioxygenase-like n=1 Tax=Clavelina lepadiformis TaxID=159417 RepID=UPI0040431970